MIATIISLKFEPKLLSSRIMQLYKTFHLVQDLRRKSKGVRRRGLKSYENGLRKKVVCFYFRHFLRRFKDCKIYCVLHLYASLVQFF